MIDSIKVLIIDGSIVVRGALSRAINGERDITVVGTVGNGINGLRKVEQYSPDVVVTDSSLPDMTMSELIGSLRHSHPETAVVVLSSFSGPNASNALRALDRGATSYASKPPSTRQVLAAIDEVQSVLLRKIRDVRAAGLIVGDATPPRLRSNQSVRRDIEAVVIGSSTGGPVALSEVLIGLRQPLPVPMFVVQHMPPMFTTALADRLDTASTTTVVEAKNGMRAQPGTCYIAPGGWHMTLRSSSKGVSMHLDDGPPVNACKPSVDPLFESAQAIFGDRVVAVMLTGMGTDGRAGSRRLADGGAPVIAQDEETSQIWGMPGAVVKDGSASEVVSLDRIPRRLRGLVTHTKDPLEDAA